MTSKVLKDPLWGNRPVKEVKRALNKATVVLPPRMEIGITFGERKESRDKEPLLGVAGFKAPLDSLEFEDEDIR